MSICGSVRLSLDIELLGKFPGETLLKGKSSISQYETGRVIRPNLYHLLTHCCNASPFLAEI